MPSQFSDLARQLAPWSLSKAECAKHCGFKFQLQYVQKRKGIAAPEKAAGRIGKAAHEVLEKYLQREARPDILKRLFLEAAIRASLTTTEIEDLCALAHNIIQFRSRFEAYKTRHQIAPSDVKLEYRFGLKEDLMPTSFFGHDLPNGRKDVFFRGVMDVLLRTPPTSSTPNLTIILDHKSGSPPQSPAEGMQQHGDQLKLYAVASRQMFPDARGVLMGLHYIQSEDIIWMEYVDTVKIQNEMVPWYYQFINDAAQAGMRPDPRKGWHCTFCEYVPMCPLNT